MRDKQIDVQMRCAVEDRPFLVRFRIDPSGRYEFVRTVRIEAGGGTKDEEDGVTVVEPAELEISVNELPFTDVRCPLCKRRVGPIRCGKCKELVCDGRVTGRGHNRLFRCSDSCGGLGIIRHAEFVARGRETQDAPPQAPWPSPQAASPLPSSPSSQSADSLRLPGPARGLPALIVKED